MEGWNVNQKKSRATTTTNLPFEMSWVLKLLNVVVISDDNLICFLSFRARFFHTVSCG